jgi:hypothetical protein
MNRPPLLSEFVSILAFAAGVALAIPLVERLHDAWWQWEKFRDYGANAHTVLSGITGLVYSALLGLVFLVSTFVVRVTRQNGDKRANVIARGTMGVAALLLFTYWSLALSDFAQVHWE